MDEAERCKAAGNDAFKAQQYQSAIQNYSNAIEKDPSNPVYYSNRAMAFLKASSISLLLLAANVVLQIRA